MTNFAKQASQYDAAIGEENTGYVRLLSTNIGTIEQQKLNGTVEIDAEPWTAKRYELGDQVEDGLGNIYEYVQNNNGIEIADTTDDNTENVVIRTLASLLTDSPKLYEYQNPTGNVTFPDADAYLEGIQWWVLARSVNNRALLDGRPAVTTGRRGGLLGVFETDTPWNTFGLIRANCGSATIFATDRTTAENLVESEEGAANVLIAKDARTARDTAYTNAASTRDSSFTTADTTLSTNRSSATSIYNTELQRITTIRNEALAEDPDIVLQEAISSANTRYNTSLNNITNTRDRDLLSANQDANSTRTNSIANANNTYASELLRIQGVRDRALDGVANADDTLISDRAEANRIYENSLTRIQGVRDRAIAAINTRTDSRLANLQTQRENDESLFRQLIDKDRPENTRTGNWHLRFRPTQELVDVYAINRNPGLPVSGRLDRAQVVAILQRMVDDDDDTYRNNAQIYFPGIGFHGTRNFEVRVSYGYGPNTDLAGQNFITSSDDALANYLVAAEQTFQRRSREITSTVDPTKTADIAIVQEEYQASLRQIGFIRDAELERAQAAHDNSEEEVIRINLEYANSLRSITDIRDRAIERAEQIFGNLDLTLADIRTTYTNALSDITAVRDRAIELANFAHENSGVEQARINREYQTSLTTITEARDIAFARAMSTHESARSSAITIYNRAIEVANNTYNLVLASLNNSGTTEGALMTAMSANAVSTQIPNIPNRPTDLLITTMNWFLPPDNGKYYFFVIFSESDSVATFNANDAAEDQLIVSVGQVVAGNVEFIGEELENGWSLQKVDFSPKDRNDFGNINATPRASTYNANINVILPTIRTQEMKIKFDDLLPVAPTLFWITGIESNGDLVYGFLDDFEITPGQAFDERNLQISVFGLV